MASAKSVQGQLSDLDLDKENRDNLLNDKNKYPRFGEVFGNNLILSNIFDELGSICCDNLKTYRIVSHLWKDEATTSLQRKYWQNRKFLLLWNEEVLKKYIETFVDSPEGTIFSCFRIEHERKWPGGRKFETDTLNQFFNQFGPMIKSLSFDCKFSLMVVYNWLSTMPSSLEELRLWIPRDFFFNTVDYIPKLNHDFKLNLTYLCLTFGLVLLSEPMGPGIPQCNKVLEVVLSKVQVPPPGGKGLKICLMQWQDMKRTIVALEKYNQIRNLKILEIRNIEVGEMKALAEIGHQIQLEYLSVDPDKLNGRERFTIVEEIYEFLCTQANNLEMLYWASPGYFKFPENGIPGLKKLRLRCAQEDLYYEPSDEELEEEEALLESIDPICYNDLFPQLEELHLLYNVAVPDPDEFAYLYLDQEEPCTSLSKLRVKYREIGVDTLRSLSTTFPFITAFELCIECPEDEKREFYETLWSDLNFVANLQELSIEIRFLDILPNHEFAFESLYSGVEEEMIKSVVDAESYDDFEPSEHVVRPSILNLTNLKKFSLCDTYRRDFRYSSSYFTDFSAFCVFGKMENLEYLHLERGIRRFSKAGFDHLKNKCKLKTDIDAVTQSVSADDKIEEVFRTGFTYEKMADIKKVNLIDSKLSDDENEHVLLYYRPPYIEGMGR